MVLYKTNSTLRHGIVILYILFCIHFFSLFYPWKLREWYWILTIFYLIILHYFYVFLYFLNLLIQYHGLSTGLSIILLRTVLLTHSYVHIFNAFLKVNILNNFIFVSIFVWSILFVFFFVCIRKPNRLYFFVLYLILNNFTYYSKTALWLIRNAGKRTISWSSKNYTQVAFVINSKSNFSENIK